MSRSGRRARVRRSTSCITGRPTRTGRSTWATRCRSASRTSSLSRRPWPGSTLRWCPDGTATGCPSRSRWTRSWGARSWRCRRSRVLRACREYAQKFIDLQRSQLVRLGVFAYWDKPYLTMSKPYEAKTLETFYDFFEKGFVYKGLKPVYWCLHDRTALAEAEVEYEMHTSPSVYVRYALTSDPAAIDPALAGKQVWTIIWTTTPWTLPASLAVAFHPEFDYVALRAGRECVHRRRGAGCGGARGLQARRREGDCQVQGREDGARDLQASVPGAERAGRERRVCHLGCGYGRGAYGSGAWRGRLLHRCAVRARPDMQRGQRRAAPERTSRSGKGARSSRRTSRSSSCSARSAR